MPALYFPVKATPFRFQAGLHPFGADFGNGEVDRLFFQVDEQRPHYLAEKRRVPAARHRVLDGDAGVESANERALGWIRETLRREHPGLFGTPPATFREIAAAVQEDLVVLRRDADGGDAAIAVDVCFPSDWRPERIAGTDFRFIHGPVPGFADTAAQARSLVAAMIDRGPYVRFVWTLKADDYLDHHPEEGRHRDWRDADEGFLRVERQTTVPFADVGASLFLIRTYLYAFSALTAAQRETIARAVETMPPAASAYKGFSAASASILRLLRR